ncbi:MAG: tRNA (adenosine(37)-N6)-threonylcarbamoyltransferase complex ATPase subunit type 1 TsaE [Myxococcota bacterium]|nr:tRNA (adenosine(37)-N6)-threonylcarbamoyltransferase complex ATPase subunit type 1 TsaE [Myxococcota bacterium]
MANGDLKVSLLESGVEQYSFFISDEPQTRRFGARLAELLRPGDVVGLCGDLGAGKTYLAGAIAHGLGVPDEVAVTSPTFTLIKEYIGVVPIYHMDLYRLGDPSELYDLGLWEYYDGAGVCLVEWCDRFEDLWPGSALVLTLTLGRDTERTIRAEGKGRGADLVQALAKKWHSPLEK